MAQDEISQVGYGFELDEVKKGSNFHFGGNFGNTYLKKFEWSNNAGKNNTQLEALDIEFEIAGTIKSYRLFPVTSATKLYNTEKGKTNEVVDISTPAGKISFNEKRKELNQIITHIVRCFVPLDAIKTAFNVQINNFQEACNVFKRLLPANFDTVKLDIFLQWQNKIGEKNTMTYLEIPRNLKFGHFVCRAMDAEGGKWNEMLNDAGLYYTDSANKKHMFERTNWYMTQTNYAKQQKENGAENNAEDAMDKDGDIQAASSDEPAW